MYSPQNPNDIESDLRINQRNLLQGLVVGVLTATGFGLGGFYLISDETGAMGKVLFLLLPFATGFATALVARSRTLVIASLIIGLLLCTAVLLATGKEGWVCVLMSLPLITVGLGIGALVGVLVRRFVIGRSTKPPILSALILLALPLFLTGANSIERPSRRVPRIETITSVLVVAAPRERVWNSIKTMERVNGHKGFLMRIGLPVPVSCSIDKEEVGGIRTCYFESGFIEERITEWSPPRVMKLEVTNWDVPGRPWLDFKDASYEFREENGNTVMTRTTTIASRLMPAWYWKRFEKIGVETEHEYLFEAVSNQVLGER
ncbi:MAG: hypothetical protein ACR2H6_14805 [Pyrinomonadaceae bacterium]